MKNDCGHPVASEESVLRCCDCEAGRRKREDDALWNAAIEAAATRIAAAFVENDMPNTAQESAAIIRAVVSVKSR